ncbi:hypothetical protein DFH06DRAFT_1077654 [Mycena polygramma]|nr:hypothetical protein DFH06DRAFT_1077654 [Mycena polygramma]
MSHRRLGWIVSVIHIFSLIARLAFAQSPPSHLPPAAPGVFAAHASILINASIDDVWSILLDFPSYPDWNPFVRSQIVTSTTLIPLADQTPHENLRLIIQSQIPPLTPPVTAATPPNPLNAHTTIENITHVDNAGYAVAWALTGTPDAILSAERWSVLSTFEDATYYESREVYDGLLAPAVQLSLEDGLDEAFEAQAEALKVRAETT